MPKNGASLLDLIVRHGIPERGARVYLAACRGGPQTASELARVAGVDRVEGYRYIRQLQTEGLLGPAGRHPMRWTALPLSELLDRWISRANDHLDHLRSQREKFLADLEESLAAPDEGDLRKFGVLEGRTRVQKFLRRRIGQSKREILVSVSGFALASAIDGGIDRALKEARGRGVRVRLVTEVTPANLVEAKHFASFTDLRHARGPVTNRAVLIDREGALVFVSGEEGLGATGEDQVGLWSTAPSFLGLARDYHTRLWSHALRFEDRVVALESPAQAVLSVGRGREEEPFQRLREIAQLGMRTTGVDVLRFDVTEMIEVVGRQIGRQMSEQVKGETAEVLGRSLSDYYAKHALGQLHVVKQRPLTLQVTDCYACTPQSPEVGRVLCPVMLRTVFESRLGGRWDVSQPDPTKHARKGCTFTATPT